jgi:uncharacterized membrane protein YbhN (UPF0104 family)
LVIEGLRIGAEALAARALFARIGASVPFRTLVRAHAIGYAIGNVLPAGRVASEAAKALLVSRHASPTEAAAVAAVNHGLYLLASASLLVVCGLIGRGKDTALVSTMAWGQACLLVCVGLGILLGTRYAPAEGKLFSRLANIGSAAAAFRRERLALPALPFDALAWHVAGRFLQIVLVATAARAASVPSDLASSLLLTAVVITSATAGDLIPGQVGAMEGAIGAVAPVLETSQARALALALVVRLTQMSWILIGGAVFIFSRKGAGGIGRKSPPAALVPSSAARHAA